MVNKNRTITSEGLELMIQSTWGNRNEGLEISRVEIKLRKNGKFKERVWGKGWNEG